MNRAFRSLALLVAIACFVWVAVLWHWQSTQRDMSVEDIGIYLVALPLTLFVLALLGRWAWNGAAQGARSREEAAAQAAAAGTAAPPPSADEAQRHATLQLLAAEACCAAGEDIASIAGAVAEGRPRPALDPELRDGSELPLMTARMADLDVEAITPEIDEAVAAARIRQPSLSRESFGPEAARALAALAGPLERVVAAIEPWRSLFAAPDATPHAPLKPALLRVLALWPADWSTNEAAIAAEWLAASLRRSGPVPAAQVLPLVLPGTASAVDPWRVVEDALQRSEAEGRRDALLVVACHSAIGAASVRRLEASGRLFTSSTPKAPIAGEGAAALLLAPSNWPAASDDADPAPRLHRGALAQRDKPVDAAGRVGSTVAEACLAQALASGPFPADSIAAAAHDGDGHTARAGEALAALLATLPQLDAEADTLAIGALAGQLGRAAPLLTIAVAAHRARALDKPCIALSVDDARARLAIVARPAAFEPAANASGAKANPT